MTFINTAYAALRLVVSAIAGFIPAMLRDLGTIGAALGGGTARPSSQVAIRAALRPAAFVVVVLLVYPALRNVYVMEFIDNPRIAAANAAKAEGEAINWTVGPRSPTPAPTEGCLGNTCCHGGICEVLTKSSSPDAARGPARPIQPGEYGSQPGEDGYVPPVMPPKPRSAAP